VFLVASEGGVLGVRPLVVELRGGRLELDWTPGGTVRMTGPAREVAHGTLTDDFLASVR
jgi:diaminopimelate epimerase